MRREDSSLFGKSREDSSFLGRAEAYYVISAFHASGAVGEFQKVKSFLARGMLISIDGWAVMCERVANIRTDLSGRGVSYALCAFRDFWGIFLIQNH